jgi:hypothetical protein
MSEQTKYNRELIAQKATHSFGYTTIGEELYNWYEQVLNGPSI